MTTNPTLRDALDKALANQHPEFICGKSACERMECQVEVLIVQHLMETGEDTDVQKAFYTHALDLLRVSINDPATAAWVPDEMAEQVIEDAALRTREAMQQPVQPHVQIEKPVLEAPAKVIRPKRTTKHQPRLTDGVVHPVVVTSIQKEQSMTTSDLSINESVLAATIDRMVNERVQAILAAKAVQPTPGEVPVAVLGNSSIMQVTRDSAAERETASLNVLPAFVVDKSLTVPALDLLDEVLDVEVPSKIRSAYNKARFRLEKNAEVLPKEATYRFVAGEHQRLAALAAARTQAKAQEVPVQQVAVVLNTTVNAKVKHLMDNLGWTQEKAEAVIAITG